MGIRPRYLLMIVWTDNPDYARDLLGADPAWRQELKPDDPTVSATLAGKLLRPGKVYSAEIHSEQRWSQSFLVERAPESQFDLLAETEEELPDAILCCAGSGDGFHGLRRRPWQALPGNIHMSALFQPHQKISGGGIAFTVLAVVTVLQVIDAVGIKDAKVKWVNDLLINESKVGGVLVHLKTQGEKVTSALVGIGLNVGTTPRIKPTVFVPKTAALKTFSPDSGQCTLGKVHRRLASTLAENYGRLIEGAFPGFLEIYRQRSIAVGRRVTVHEDSDTETLREIARGQVTSIGENLELTLRGVDKPVWRGRLVLDAPDPTGKL